MLEKEARSAEPRWEPPLHDGFLVVCSACSRVKITDLVWRPAPAGVLSRHVAHLSHGICPDCLRRLYPELVAFRSGLP